MIKNEDTSFANTNLVESYKSTSDSDGTLLLYADRELNNGGEKVETETYHRRWYMLLVFFINAFVQIWVLNTFSPVAQATLLIGWSLDYVALLQVVWCITATIGAPICVWIMDRKGLRFAMLFSILTLVVGCVIRCTTSEPSTLAILTMIGYAINGVGGAVPMSGASVLSSIWFPPKQRAFATAAAVEATNLGVAASMIIGPAIMSGEVPIVDTENANGSQAHLDETKDAILSDTMLMMYIQCGMGVGLLVVVLSYYPNQPPKPPSISASCDRVEFVKGLTEALKSWKLWLLFIPYGTGCSMYYCWTSVYNVILQPVGMSVTQAGCLAFSANVFAIVAALFMSIFAGMYIHHIKMICIMLLGVATVASILFTCFALGYVPFSVGWLYISALVSVAIAYAIVPVCFELACELVFPVNENIVCLMLQGWGDFFIILFYLLFLIPSPHRAWLNWVIVVSTILSLLSFISLPEFYARMNIDETAEGNKNWDTDFDAASNREECDSYSSEHSEQHLSYSRNVANQSMCIPGLD